MKYIQDAQGAVHGFDDTNAEEVNYMHTLFFTGGALNPGCTDVTASWPPAATPVPNNGQFELDLMAAVGGLMGTNVVIQNGPYPLLFAALEKGNWGDVQTMVIDANTRSIITPAQYTAIKAAATANNIPVTLP